MVGKTKEEEYSYYLDTHCSTEILETVALRGYIYRGRLQHHRLSRDLAALVYKTRGIAEADSKQPHLKLYFIKVFTKAFHYIFLYISLN